MAGRNTSGAAGTGEQVKIASIVRQVPDAEARIRAEGGSVSLEGVSFILDGMDEYGTEEALRLREGGLDAEIIVFAAGPARTEEAVRTALAMGADRAVFVETDEPLDVLAQAQLLAGLIKDEQIDLVLVGGKQADWDSAGLGAALAEALGWPLSDWTTSLELNGSSLRTRHDTDAGSEQLELPLPAVVTTQQGLNEPRYPTLPNIMKARRKELKVLSLAEAGQVTPLVRAAAQTIETRERRNEMIEGDAATAARELVRRLREEARVL